MNQIIQLAQTLIKLPSFSPNDAGCQKIIAEKLHALKFNVELMQFNKTTNLWAYRGGNDVSLILCGHTDIVPVGNIYNWKFPPFEGRISNNILYGRGAADMKGALAAMIIAAEHFVIQNPHHKGRLGFLITSDEEGNGIDGIKKIVETLINRKEQINYCLIGEPSSNTKIGDTIKNGRRGSLTAKITIYGIQGHTAYPHLAKNPIHLAIMHGLNTLINTTWDNGNITFPQTTMQINKINSGTSSNIIPGELTAELNFRFNNISTEHSIQEKINTIMNHHKLNYKIDWLASSQPYFSPPRKLANTTIKIIKNYQKITPKLDTGGGTSDGRFMIKTGAEIIELGAKNTTIHKINECINIQDLKILSKIYQNIMYDLLVF